MIQQQTDKRGVPVLSASDIELKAEELISYFNATVLNKPVSTPLVELAKELHERFGVICNYSLDLGMTKHGSKILGKTQFKPLGLYLDKSLVNDPRFRFVLGHELGHVVMHRKVDVKKSGYDEQELVDTEHDFVTGKKLLRTARDWIEWQANRFSSAILMPRTTVHFAVLEAQENAGIVRNLGKIILLKEPYSYKDFRMVVDHLTIVYDVNATNVEFRLTDLGILDDRRMMNVKHISELFITE